MYYTQSEPGWGSRLLGHSGLTSAQAGCYDGSIAQILTQAGWNINPGQVIDALNANGGFTADGLTIHAKVTEAFPQFRWDANGTYQLVGGLIANRFYHFVSKMPSGQIIDPLYGREGVPPGFVANTTQNIAVDQAPAPQPASEFPKTVTVKSNVYVRERPDQNSPLAGSKILQTGDTFIAVDRVTGTNPYGVTDKWYQSEFGHFVYSGNCS